MNNIETLLLQSSTYLTTGADRAGRKVFLGRATAFV
jgi:hypothetical protein